MVGAFACRLPLRHHWFPSFCLDEEEQQGELLTVLPILVGLVVGVLLHVVTQRISLFFVANPTKGLLALSIASPLIHSIQRRRRRQNDFVCVRCVCVCAVSVCALCLCLPRLRLVFLALQDL